MSRYTYYSGKYELVVGWDHLVNTYFAQVFDDDAFFELADEDESKALKQWKPVDLGAKHSEYLDADVLLDDFFAALKDKGIESTLPKNILELLTGE